MGVVTVSMPADLLSQIDTLVEEHGYASRSEVFRDAGRKLVSEFADHHLQEKSLAGVLMITYPYGHSEIERELFEFRHDRAELVRSHSHSCLGDDDGCLETLVIEGELETIATVGREVESISEQLQVSHQLFPIEMVGEQCVCLKQSQGL